MLVYLTLIGGIVLSALGILFSPLIARGLGADGALLTNCVLYARITLLSMPAFMLQNVFQSFFVTAEKTKLGLGVIVIAGVTNMVLDFLLVGVFQIGLPVRHSQRSPANVSVVCFRSFILHAKFQPS